MATDTDREYLDSVIGQSKRRLARIMTLEDILYNAEQFIQSVTHWDGGQDDQEEALREIRAALSDERKLTDG